MLKTIIIVISATVILFLLNVVILKYKLENISGEAKAETQEPSVQGLNYLGSIQDCKIYRFPGLSKTMIGAPNMVYFARCFNGGSSITSD